MTEVSPGTPVAPVAPVPASAVRVVGAPGVATVLLLHGGGPGNDAELSFSPALGALTRTGLRCVLVDLPADVVGVARRFGPVAVVGHSLGGRAACRLALAAPELVTHLVVVSSGAVAPDGNLDAAGAWTAPSRALLDFASTEPDAFVEVWRRTAVGGADERRLRDAHARWLDRGGPLRDPDALERHRRERDELDARLGGIDRPTLLLWGRQDASTPWWRALPLLDRLPRAELRVLPRCGHLVMWDQPTAFASVVAEFVGRPR